MEVLALPRIVLLSALALLCGCDASSTAVRERSNEPLANASPTQRESAFDYDEAAGVVSLFTDVPPPAFRAFGLGQGSITLETIEARNGELTFRYTPEIEGGYTVYECVVPISSRPVTIKVNTDGTPGETSFDLAECRIVKTGNLHEE